MKSAPKWITKTKKIRGADYAASHTQRPGSTRVLHMKGKSNLYKIKIKSTGQYSISTIFKKARKKK